ncbi:esterase [Nocardioides marmoriginsengisoli]|uniref:Esterase n=1 Tax=Nocardioides marmoriginsengisoli TaxID=661483 RepID=A0A3N0CLH5_9ACTN|nr:alpha/beta hydrolase-fold protein [Nocardioides marmoriginsengisoli]RNL64307.1 esterase [Nocardioides marmoriginsengisoli]
MLTRALAALALALGVAGLAPLDGAQADPTSGPTLLDVSIPAVHGPIDDKWLPGYTGGPRAKVLLPAGYDPDREYPLLVLLIGLTSSYHMWSDAGLGQIAKTAGGLDAIIVMPEAGNGWYTDWWNKGRRGGPSWETYLLEDVIPYAVANYPIRPERRWHALAGVSMGGLGTTYLGGRLPGFFGSISVFSGLVDTHLIYGENLVQSFIPQYLAKTPTYDPQIVYGPEFGFYSLGHDPTRLAANLRNTRVFLTTGNGIPTEDGEPHRDAPTDAAAEGLIIRPAMNKYAQALRAAGVPITSRVHTGAHSWPNFRSEFKEAMAWGFFEPVVEHPTTWVNDTVATRGTLWGIDYAFTTPPTRIVRFSRNGGSLSVSAAGSPVTLRTAGGCSITTPTPATVPVAADGC